MRRALTLVVLLALTMVGLVAVPAAHASPNMHLGALPKKPQCAYESEYTAICLDMPITDGTAGSVKAAPEPDTRPAADSPERKNDRGNPCIDQRSKNLEAARDKPVPCTSKHGIWSNASSCYLSPTPSDPQPPRSSPVWEHFDGMFDVGENDGAVYDCYNPFTGTASLVFLNDPPTAAAAGPTPGDVAEMAVARMELHAIEIGIAPGTDSVAIVGVPVWLWVADPSPQTFGPITASASAGGISVTATARVESITWDLGDGTTIECTAAGTPYQARFAGQESPDCGHIYVQESGGQPGQDYTVTATSTWVVEWEGAGQTGTITLDGLVADTSLTVGEGQVLVS